MTIYKGTLTATDGSGQTATAEVVIESVAAPLSVTDTVTPPSGPVGTTFRIKGLAEGGTPPISLTISKINNITPTPVAGSPGEWTIVI